MNKLFGNTVTASLSLGIAVLSLGGGALSASALPTLVSLKFPQAPENTSAPRATVGGGVRSGGGQCLSNKMDTPALQALIPPFLISPKTTSQTPTLYFYFPDNQGQTGEISLENILGETIYQKRLSLDSQAGIVSVTLLPNTPLDPNDIYNWKLRVMCNPDEPSQDIFLKGSFEYVDRPAALPAIPEKLVIRPRESSPSTVTPETTEMALAIAKAYAEQGFWLDSLNLVSFAYPSAPQEWSELLNSVGFEALAEVPLSNCCQSQSSQ